MKKVIPVMIVFLILVNITIYAAYSQGTLRCFAEKNSEWVECVPAGCSPVYIGAQDECCIPGDTTCTETWISKDLYNISGGSCAAPICWGPPSQCTGGSKVQSIGRTNSYAECNGNADD